jgi:hypothetical protein
MAEPLRRRFKRLQIAGTKALTFSNMTQQNPKNNHYSGWLDRQVLTSACTVMMCLYIADEMFMA